MSDNQGKLNLPAFLLDRPFSQRLSLLMYFVLFNGSLLASRLARSFICFSSTFGFDRIVISCGFPQFQIVVAQSSHTTLVVSLTFGCQIIKRYPIFPISKIFSLQNCSLTDKKYLNNRCITKKQFYSFQIIFW